MITAEELLATPHCLLSRNAEIAPRKAAAEKKQREDKAEEERIYRLIAGIPPGAVVNLTELGTKAPAVSAKRRAREDGLLRRVQGSEVPEWRRTGKGAGK